MSPQKDAPNIPDVLVYSNLSVDHDKKKAIAYQLERAREELIDAEQDIDASKERLLAAIELVKELGADYDANVSRKASINFAIGQLRCHLRLYRCCELLYS